MAERDHDGSEARLSPAKRVLLARRRRGEKWGYGQRQALGMLNDEGERAIRDWEEKMKYQNMRRRGVFGYGR